MKYAWILKYGFDYEHVNIEGIYSSFKRADEARKKTMVITNDDYDYYIIDRFEIDK